MSDDALAVAGGTPVRTAPWPARRLFGADERAAAAAVFDSWNDTGGMGYNGADENAYCEEFAAFHGGGFADAVNSGTTALWVALRALDLEPFTEVVVPAITDPGGVMPVPLMNCIPVPADTEPRSFNCGPEQIAARVTERTSAIVVAHIGGHPVDMDPVLELARQRGIPVIEDAAQAHGALYKGRLAGAMGDVAAFSTMAGKHHATGGQGGVVYTRDEELYWRARRHSDRGKPLGLAGATGNVTAGLNLNQSDLHAAVGRVQLRRLPAMLETRRAFAAVVAEGCAGLAAVDLWAPPADSRSAYWFLTFVIDPGALTVDKSAFVAALQAEGIPLGDRYVGPWSKADWYRNRNIYGTSGLPWSAPQYEGDRDRDYPVPNAEALDGCLCRLGVHERCDEALAADVVAALTKVDAAYRK